MMYRVSRKPMNGLNDSKKTEFVLKFLNVQYDRRHETIKKTSLKQFLKYFDRH